MLARLQRFMTLGLLALAVAWAVWHWQAGRPGWALAGALLILFGHAPVLALEFGLMHRVNAGDAAPRAHAGQLLRAWWGEVRAAPVVFCWRQPFRSTAWPDLLPARRAGRQPKPDLDLDLDLDLAGAGAGAGAGRSSGAGSGSVLRSSGVDVKAGVEAGVDVDVDVDVDSGAEVDIAIDVAAGVDVEVDLGSPARRRGLLLVHGFVCNRGLWNPWLAQLHALGVPHVAVNLEPVFGRIDDYVPIIEAAVARLEEATGMAPVAVAHSMGGLALRRWAVDHGGLGRLHHAITLGAPHGGTWLARFAMSPNGAQMRPGGRWLRDLAAREAPVQEAQLTCFYSHCDNIVFPASAALLPGARAVHLPGVAHVQMADRHEPRAEAMRWLGCGETLQPSLSRP